jgi:hypothetical protein
MSRELRRLDWHEQTEGRSWRCRFRERDAPGCSIFAAILGAPILLFLVGFGPASACGGVVPIVAVLMMTLPVVAISLVALRADAEEVGYHSIHVGSDQLWYESASGYREVIAASEVRDIVEKSYCAQALDGKGKVLLSIYTRSPKFVSGRVRAAFERAREPTTYRG